MPGDAAVRRNDQEPASLGHNEGIARQPGGGLCYEEMQKDGPRERC